MTELAIPTNLSFDELVEWLRGAGYTETFVLTVMGDTHHTFTNIGPADGSPDIIGVIESADGLTIKPVWEITDADHDYDDECECRSCGEVRAEDAALRRVGR